uniref:NTR domain-containing protein n=1 Tax=Neovison vison TaxID=452646 RepID=A0A8C7BPF1_NEOVI
MPQGEKAVRTDDYLSFWALGVLQKLRCPLAQTARGPTMDPSLLLAFLLLLALSTPSSACNCKIQHPQTYYCTSDIVLVADILGPGKNTRTKRGFRVNVLKAPRGTPRIHEIYTPINWVDCGYGLRTHQQSLLLIAGFLRAGTVFFTRCHLVYFWYRLTREQKLGFEAAYRAGCECEVSSHLSDLSLQPRHCHCPFQIFIPCSLPFWMIPAPSSSFHETAESMHQLCVISPSLESSH